jgi:hypothetical protein
MAKTKSVDEEKKILKEDRLTFNARRQEMEVSRKSKSSDKHGLESSAEDANPSFPSAMSDYKPVNAIDSTPIGEKRVKIGNHIPKGY